MDIENKGFLSQEEFKTAMQNLGIILNLRDYNNVFTLFDLDKSNTVSLSQMKKKLYDIESQISENNSHVNQDFENLDIKSQNKSDAADNQGLEDNMDNPPSSSRQNMKSNSSRNHKQNSNRQNMSSEISEIKKRDIGQEHNESSLMSMIEDK